MQTSQRARKLLSGVIQTEHDLRDEITARIAASGSSVAVAVSLGISVQFLGDILHGRRPVSGALAEKLGYRRVTLFVKG